MLAWVLAVVACLSLCASVTGFFQLCYAVF